MELQVNEDYIDDTGKVITIVERIVSFVRGIYYLDNLHNTFDHNGNQLYFDKIFRRWLPVEEGNLVRRAPMFTDNFLKEIGFQRLCGNVNSQYGQATKGMTKIDWNLEGRSMTYSGTKLEDNVAVTILKDGGTRTAFSGYVFNREDLKKVLSLVE